MERFNMKSSTTRRTFLGQVAGVAAAATVLPSAMAQGQAPAATLTEKAVTFLRSRQEADGSWSPDRKEPGITALVVTGLMRSKRVTASEPTITKALSYLEGFVDASGGMPKAAHANYSTAIALMAFKEANVGGRYDAIIRGSQEFMKSKQWDEAEGKQPADAFYGGAGYGGNNSRPDLSNTSFMIEALRESGVPADDPALQKALVFISRCQNLKSEFNDQPWADDVNDGGFIYTAANGGSSVAGMQDGGGLRSYASMTYAGLKSMIYAGLTADDPRVKAATEYLAKHYSVEENPGLGQRGVYYYYQALAKTLSLLGKTTFTDANKQDHDWRADLVGALAKRQDANGSWVNKNDGFMEGDANLVTSYGLLALSYVG